MRLPERAARKILRAMLAIKIPDSTLKGVRQSDARIRRFKMDHSVWIYFRNPEAGEQAIRIIQRHRSECFGSGTDLTNGESDVSYSVTRRTAIAVVRKIRATCGRKVRVDAYDEHNNRLHITEKNS